jgi:hypothetical protein
MQMSCLVLKERLEWQGCLSSENEKRLEASEDLDCARKDETQGTRRRFEEGEQTREGCAQRRDQENRPDLGTISGTRIGLIPRYYI